MSLWRQISFSIVLGWVIVTLPLVALAGIKVPQPTSSSTTLPAVLTVQQVAQRIRQYHPTLRLARFDVGLASAKRLEKQGAFDPVLAGSSYFNRYNSSSSPGKALEAVEADGAIKLQTRSGIEVMTGAKLARGDIKTPLSPTGEGGEYYAGLKVPLLRGLGINAKAAEEQKALLGEPLSEASLRQVELNVLLSGLNAYWDWVGAWKKQQIETELLTLANIRTQAVERLAEAGDSPAIDAVEARSEVQRRVGRLARAQRSAEQASNKLAVFLWEELTPTTTPTPVLTTIATPTHEQVPSQWEIPTPYGTEALADGKLKALASRPELKALELSRQLSQVDVKLAKNNLLPQLDALITQGLEVGDSGIGPVIKAGISVAVPLRLRTAQGQLKQATISVQKVTLQEQQLIQRIFVDIADALSAINAAYERYEAASQELLLAQQLQVGEQTRFNLGDSTVFLVNQRERAAAEANVTLVDALVDYQAAVNQYQAVTGQL
ncbi:MAG: TolC family protein [Vampirovibrionales bacterium]|nr:TolC family protein [Vampirovibrionales bacterium]